MQPYKEGNKSAFFFSLVNRNAVVRGSAVSEAPPVTCVPKKGKSIRVCLNYKMLNKHKWKENLDGVKGYYNLKQRDLVVNYLENYN